MLDLPHREFITFFGCTVDHAYIADKLVLRILCLDKLSLSGRLGRSRDGCSVHIAGRQVTQDTEELRFNTAIAAMMEFVNGAMKWEVRPRTVLVSFTLLLSPYAPHLAEEMWQVRSWVWGRTCCPGMSLLRGLN